MSSFAISNLLAVFCIHDADEEEEDFDAGTAAHIDLLISKRNK